MQDYQKRIEAEAVRLGLDKRVGVTMVNVLHDDDCPMCDNKGRGVCNCTPDIVFTDETGKRIEPVVQQ